MVNKRLANAKFKIVKTRGARNYHKDERGFSGRAKEEVGVSK